MCSIQPHEPGRATAGLHISHPASVTATAVNGALPPYTELHASVPDLHRTFPAARSGCLYAARRLEQRAGALLPPTAALLVDICPDAELVHARLRADVVVVVVRPDAQGAARVRADADAGAVCEPEPAGGGLFKRGGGFAAVPQLGGGGLAGVVPPPGVHGARAVHRVGVHMIAREGDGDVVAGAGRGRGPMGGAEGRDRARGVGRSLSVS